MINFNYCKYFLLFFLLVSFSGRVVAQKAPIRIKGTVLSAENKKPLPGATILIVRLMNGVSADSLGLFTVTIQPSDTLLIRSIGCKPQLYVPASKTAAELKPVIYLEEVVTVLEEVEISGRPSDKKIRTALNNMKRKEPSVTANPSPKPIIPEAMPTTPVEPSALQNPISFFSRQEREKRALQQILERVEAEEAYRKQQKEKEQYNRLFKDNRGYK